jgi:hypothetical protein
VLLSARWVLLTTRSVLLSARLGAGMAQRFIERGHGPVLTSSRRVGGGHDGLAAR